MRKEDVKVGMKVRVKDSTWHPQEHTRAMVGHIVEVRCIGARSVGLFTPQKGDYWYFNFSDIEPAEPSQVPSVTINGTVYVPEDTIKTPEPAPAPKFFWGQWVSVEGVTQPAMVISPTPDYDREIRVIHAGRGDWIYCRASRCTPIGA